MSGPFFGDARRLNEARHFVDIPARRSYLRWPFTGKRPGTMVASHTPVLLHTRSIALTHHSIPMSHPVADRVRSLSFDSSRQDRSVLLGLYRAHLLPRMITGAEELDAPVVRVGDLEAPVSFDSALEFIDRPKRSQRGSIKALLAY